MGDLSVPFCQRMFILDLGFCLKLSYFRLISELEDHHNTYLFSNRSNLTLQSPYPITVATEQSFIGHVTLTAATDLMSKLSSLKGPAASVYGN